MKLRIFKVEDHVLELDRDELRLIPEFKEILVRDKVKKGSTTFTIEKALAYKEFKYIYFMCDYKSPYVNYPDIERSRASIKDSDLEPRYVPDDDVIRAMIKYKELQETPSIKILNSLQRGLMLSSSVIDNICGTIEYQLEDIKKLKSQLSSDSITLQGEDKLSLMIKTSEYTKSLVDNLNILQGLGDKVPKTLKNVEELSEKIRTETEGEGVVKGGKKIGNRANPK